MSILARLAKYEVFDLSVEMQVEMSVIIFRVNFDLRNKMEVKPEQRKPSAQSPSLRFSVLQEQIHTGFNFLQFFSAINAIITPSIFTFWFYTEISSEIKEKQRVLHLTTALKKKWIKNIRLKVGH